jgi:cytochrome c-type biogenesis protein CcmH
MAMRKILVALSFLTVLTVLLPVPLALAQSGEDAGPSDDEVNAIAKQLYCPVCENIPLDVCPTQACAQWRDLIREKLSEGWSEQRIKNYFVDQYGDRVLATPPARGINWMVYLVPPVAILLGVIILVAALRSMRQKPPRQAASAPTDPDQADEDYIRRLEEEIRKTN